VVLPGICSAGYTIFLIYYNSTILYCKYQ